MLSSKISLSSISSSLATTNVTSRGIAPSQVAYPDWESLEQQVPPVNWTYNQRHAPQLVLPGLYIGSLQVSRSLPELRERGITHIIHACDSDGRPLPSSLTTMHSYDTSDNIINNTGMPLLSDGGPVIELKTIDIYDRGRHSLAAFSDASQFCRLAWANGSNVLIYCLTGIDASPVIAVAIVMEMTGMACVDAMHWVQMRRRCTNIRGVYLRLLEEYEPVLYAQQTAMNETALTIDPSLHGSLQQQSSKRSLRDHNNDHEDDETMGHSHRKNLLLDSTATDSNANSASPITICTLPINWSGPN